MTSIYDKHDAAFNRVSAFVVLKDGERVATVALKFPADGAGRLYAYVHWIGTQMVRGFASGGGYDKRSAAVESAVEKMPPYGETDDYGNDWSKEHAACELFRHAFKRDGYSWDRQLEDAGFTVLQAV